MFVIKGIALRFNGALGFGGGCWVRACRHDLSGLIGGGACEHAPYVCCRHDLSGLIGGRCVRARTLRQEHRHRGGAGAGEGRDGEGVLSGAGGVAGGSGGWADDVVAGGGGAMGGA